MIILHTDIEWINKKYGNIKFQNGTISFSEDAITVLGNLSSKDAENFSRAHHASIDVRESFLKNVVFTNTTLGSINVSLDLSGCSYVELSTVHCAINEYSISWNLSSAVFSYITEDPSEYRIISAPYIHLASLLGKIGFDLPNQSIMFGKSKYTFSPTSNPGFSKVAASNGWEDIDGLLSLLTLYTQCPISTIASFTVDKEEKQRVSWSPCKFDMSKEGLSNYDLRCMDIGQSNSLRYFLESATWISYSEHEKNELTKAIYTYAKSKYIPLHLQFLTTYSILDRFAGNTHGKDPYDVMKKRLSDYGIDIRKIGKSSDPTIIRLRLTLERENNKDKDVTNFCDLRNYIMHFMSTVEIDDYLDNGELVSNMTFAVLVILLKKLGFKKCGFKKDWTHLSIIE